MTDKKKVGLEYYGELWTAPGRTYGLYGDFNQYALGITTGDKHPVTKYLYITHLSEVFVRLRDIIVKEHLKRQSGPAFERVYAAVQLAEANILKAIERLTGDSKMARIAGGLEQSLPWSGTPIMPTSGTPGTDLRGRNHD